MGLGDGCVGGNQILDAGVSVAISWDWYVRQRVFGNWSFIEGAPWARRRLAGNRNRRSSRSQREADVPRIGKGRNHKRLPADLDFKKILFLYFRCFCSLIKAFYIHRNSFRPCLRQDTHHPQDRVNVCATCRNSHVLAVSQNLPNHPTAGGARAHFNEDSHAVFVGGVDDSCEIETFKGLAKYRISRAIGSDLVRAGANAAVEAHTVGHMRFKNVQVSVCLCHRLYHFAVGGDDIRYFVEPATECCDQFFY